MTQQLYKNQFLFDQIKVLNTFCKEKRELLLLFILKKVLAMNVVNEIIAIAKVDNEIDKILKY